MSHEPYMQAALDEARRGREEGRRGRPWLLFANEPLPPPRSAKADDKHGDDT